MFHSFPGSTPIGEYFNPAFDCSDIIDKEKDPESGLYWVNLETAKRRQVRDIDNETTSETFLLISVREHSVVH